MVGIFLYYKYFKIPGETKAEGGSSFSINELDNNIIPGVVESLAKTARKF